MHALYGASVYHEISTFFPNYVYHKMDYRQKMVIPPTQKYTNEDDDDDEDLEALRLAALKSLRAKPVCSNSKTTAVAAAAPFYQNNPNHSSRPQYAQYNQRFGRRDFYHPNRPPRQNGNVYHPSRVNQNLIEIIPVDENLASVPDEHKVSTDTLSNSTVTDDSKFKRFNDNASGSDEEDVKDQKVISEPKFEESEESHRNKEDQRPDEDSPKIDNENELLADKEDGEEDANDEEDGEDIDEENDKEVEDDDDILLMADLEEEDSLERLMDEMEKEMNVGKPSSEKKEKKSSKKDSKESKRSRESKSKNHASSAKIENSLCGPTKSMRRSVSPYRNRSSLSPKVKLRKKSPRRSPPRQPKKSQREPPRPRSPRKSPPRYSPRPRSPLPRSPRRSPNRSPIRRLSPRPHSRSPLRVCRSRSPKLISRSRSPRFVNRTRSPLGRSSPTRSPLPRSPRLSPRRSRSPRSPKNSPRRNSPRISPRRSPWSSPRNSPRLSPRRRRCSPSKDRKRRSPTPEETLLSHKKENSPARIKNVSPDILKSKQVKAVSKEIIDLPNDPVLEARRRKFESMEPINPVNANKKIKLSKKEEAKFDNENIQINSPKRKTNEIVEEYEEILDEELSMRELYDDFDDLEQILSDAPMSPAMCVETAPPVKVEKEKVKKKKKKDKEIYQIGKLKDTTLSGRTVKESKKSKKKKEMTPEIVEQPAEEIVDEQVDEETDLRTELSRRRAERLNRAPAIQSARLLQSAFKGVVKEVAKNNAKVNQRHLVNKNEDKLSQKEVRRVTVLHRPIQEISDSEETVDSKVPVKFRLGLNKVAPEMRESKSSRKTSKRQGRKVKHKNNLSVSDIDHD